MTFKLPILENGDEFANKNIYRQEIKASNLIGKTKEFEDGGLTIDIFDYNLNRLLESGNYSVNLHLLQEDSTGVILSLKAIEKELQNEEAEEIVSNDQG